MSRQGKRAFQPVDLAKKPLDFWHECRFVRRRRGKIARPCRPISGAAVIHPDVPAAAPGRLNFGGGDPCGLEESDLRAQCRERILKAGLMANRRWSRGVGACARRRDRPRCRGAWIGHGLTSVRGGSARLGCLAGLGFAVLLSGDRIGHLLRLIRCERAARLIIGAVFVSSLSADAPIRRAQDRGALLSGDHE